MFRGIAALLFLLASAVTSAHAQQTITQSGSVTNGHVTCFTISDVVQDCGPANEGFAAEFGITKNGGLPFCISTAQDPASNIKFCLSISADSASLIINSFHGATAPPCNIVINGTSLPCIGAGTTVTRKITSGTTDTASTQDGSIVWASGTTGAKTENLYACTSATKGAFIRVADEIGTASTYPISIVPAGSDTIAGSVPLSSYPVSVNNMNSTVQCDGTGTWVLE